MKIKAVGSFHIVPLPKERDVWLLTDENQDRPNGPYAAVAVGIPLNTFRYAAPDPSPKEGLMDIFDWPTEDGAEELKTTPLYFLVLFPDFGDLDTTWVSQHCVFFTAEAAEMALKTRKQEDLEALL